MENIAIKCQYSELVDIDKIIQNPRNPNTHDDRQLKVLIKNLKVQGFRHPLIVSKRSGFLVVGHGRLMAALEMGLKQVPVDYQDFENEAIEFSFMVADNKIAGLSKHDDAVMIDGIKDLNLEDYDFDLLGLPDFNFMSLMDEDVELDEKPKKESDVKKYILEIQFANEMDMMDVHDDLMNQGHDVKVK